jgi:C4-dicarboxylate transporter DctM subunit
MFDGILSATGLLSVLLMVFLSLFIVIQVVCRYFFSVNIPGLFDLSIYSLLVFTFISAAYTSREGSQICVDLLVRHLSERSQAVISIFTRTAALLFLAVLIWFSWKWARNAFSSGSMTISELPIPKGILISSITIGTTLLFMQTLREMFHSIHLCFQPSDVNTNSVPSRKLHYALPVVLVAGLIAAFVITVYVNEFAGICIGALLILLSGMPVFLSLGFVGSLGMVLLISESTIIQVPFLSYKSVESFPLTCLPLFIIAGIIMERGKIVEDVFELFRYMVGGFFCAISGSSVATTSLIAAVSLPILVGSGYKKSISSGVVAGSTIGTVIPPSIGYVLYGVIAEESIGRLFIAGVFPAVMIFGFYCLYVIILSIINSNALLEKDYLQNKQEAPSQPHKDISGVFRRALCGLFTPIFVLGGIYLGIFTPTETAAIMVVYAVIITVFVMKTINVTRLYDAFVYGVKISSMILVIIVGAKIFGALTSQLGIASGLVRFSETSGVSPLKALAIISAILIVLGMFLDAASIMVITLPVFHPVITSAGFDSVWFGVFYIIILEIGLLTPPVGLNLFIIKGLSNFSMATIIKGTFPFVLILLASLIILVLFPQIAIWLPSFMVK